MLALEIESSPGSCKRSLILGRVSKVLVLVKLVRTRILHVNTLSSNTKYWIVAYAPPQSFHIQISRHAHDVFLSDLGLCGPDLNQSMRDDAVLG